MLLHPLWPQPWQSEGVPDLVLLVQQLYTQRCTPHSNCAGTDFLRPMGLWCLLLPPGHCTLPSLQRTVRTLETERLGSSGKLRKPPSSRAQECRCHVCLLCASECCLPLEGCSVLRLRASCLSLVAQASHSTCSTCLLHGLEIVSLHDGAASRGFSDPLSRNLREVVVTVPPGNE